MRRSSDISQEKSFIAAPEAGKHNDPKFGTHHALMPGTSSTRWVSIWTCFLRQLN
jgi:hypothetical protein